MKSDEQCPRCEHQNGVHVLLTNSDPREGGAIVCNADGCTCIGTWAPSWEGHPGLPPDFAQVVAQVSQWAKIREWSEDRLIDTLARFERMRK